MNLIIIQIRNGSTRLPFKSSLSICGQPVLFHLIRRLEKIKINNSKIIVATSNSFYDDPIESLCKANNIDCFRGDLLNVFSRFKYLVEQFKPNYVVRITGDCPLIYSPLIKELLNVIIDNHNIDYISNTINRTSPKGFDVEIFNSNILLNKFDPSEKDKEHVTAFMYESNSYKTFYYQTKEDFSNIRVTLDTYLDYLLIEKVLNKWVSYQSKNDVFDLIDASTLNKLISTNNDIRKLHEEAINYSQKSFI